MHSLETIVRRNLEEVGREWAEDYEAARITSAQRLINEWYHKATGDILGTPPYAHVKAGIDAHNRENAGQ